MSLVSSSQFNVDLIQFSNSVKMFQNSSFMKQSGLSYKAALKKKIVSLFSSTQFKFSSHPIESVQSNNLSNNE